MRRNDTLIRRKFNAYLIPGVLMVMAMQLGNTVDGIFVSHMIDLDGLTAINLSLPVLGMMQVIGFVTSMGGEAVISVMLGKREIKDASQVFSAGLLTVLGTSLLFTVAAPFATRPIANLLTPSPVLAELAEQYLFIFMLFIPVLNGCIYMASMMTIDNSPTLGAACFIIANAVNLTLDYFFLKNGMGMRGTALSTIIGYCAGLLVVFPYMRNPNRMLFFHFQSSFSGLRRLPEIFRAGAAQGALFVLQTLMDFTMNTLVQNSLGPDYLAIYAVCVRSIGIITLFIEGVIGLVQTIAGVLFGEKDYFGIRALMKRTAVSSLGLALALTVFFNVFPQGLLILFSFDKMQLYNIALSCVRLYSLSFVFYTLNRLTQVYYQATLKTSLATLDAVLQSYVLLIPSVILVMKLMGIRGVCLGVVLAEALTFLVVSLYRVLRQRRGRLPQKGFLMIPDKDPATLFDVTISSTEADAVQAGQALLACCRENGIDSHTANILSIAAEEMCVNIARYGYKRSCAIDICLSRTEKTLILRLRDDGVPFDPTEYKQEEGDFYKVSGITIIRRMVKKLSYVRVLNMNNTIIEM